MKIYIDESGLFSAHADLNTVDKAWCTVGAVSVPHFKERALCKALIELKETLGVKPVDEIKNQRPDPGSPIFISFIEKLKDANCTIHAMTANRSLLNDGKTDLHKQTQIDGRERYLDQKKEAIGKKRAALMRAEVDEITKLIWASSAQEYNQVIIQSALIAFMLDKLLVFYETRNPGELSRFSWVFDKKNQNPGVSEFLFSKLMPAFVEVGFIREPRGIPPSENAYKYFFGNYGVGSASRGMSSDDLLEKKMLYGIDYSQISGAMMSFDFGKLLNGDSRFCDSKRSPGLQVADLVVSSLNRLLRGNVDDPAKVAKILGALTLCSPRLDVPTVPQIHFYEPSASGPEINRENLEMLNLASNKIYTDRFREGFTRNIDGFTRG